MPPTLGQSEESAGDDAPARLPRGPHRLTAEEVKASQRARLISSMLDLVGERGWSETTVPQVVAAARVSKNAFYELFDDKVDCYLAAVDQEVGDLLGSLRTPPAADWRATLEHGMGVYLRWWQDRPRSARAYLVELPEAGARAVEQRERAYRALERVFARLAAQIRAESRTCRRFPRARCGRSSTRSPRTSPARCAPGGSTGWTSAPRT